LLIYQVMESGSALPMLEGFHVGVGPIKLFLFALLLGDPLLLQHARGCVHRFQIFLGIFYPFQG
jgi:hypothetical protein